MITQEIKQEIFEAYNDRTNTVRDLEITYGLPRTAITRIAVEMGATPRRPKSYAKRHGGGEGLPRLQKNH